MDPNAVRAHLANLSDADRKEFLKAVSRKGPQGWGQHLKKDQVVDTPWGGKAKVRSAGKSVLVLERV